MAKCVTCDGQRDTLVFVPVASDERVGVCEACAAVIDRYVGLLRHVRAERRELVRKKKARKCRVPKKP